MYTLVTDGYAVRLQSFIYTPLTTGVVVKIEVWFTMYILNKLLDMESGFVQAATFSTLTWCCYNFGQ